jgi:hypothetical protein
MTTSSLTALATLLACFCTAALAEETICFGTYENDSFFDSDRHYSSGVQLSAQRRPDQRGELERNWSAALCRPMGCAHWRQLTSQSNLGQLIYTPIDIADPAPQPQDRPWAGLLYYEQVDTFVSPDEDSLTILALQAGVTGRLALAEPTQKLIHRLLDRPRPNGWEHQLGGTLGIMLSVERRSALPAFSVNLGRRVRLNTASYWRVNAGNIQTYAAAGLAVVVGKDLPVVSSPPPGVGNKLRSSRPSLASCWFASIQCTGFGSVEARLMGYNKFLGGQTESADLAIEPRVLVYDLVLGVRVDLARTRSDGLAWFVQYKVTRRSPEFRSTIPLPHQTLGALTIGTEF